MNTSAAVPVTDPSGVGEARRAAATLADRLHFDDARTGRVSLIATELGTNLAKHARGGEVLLRSIEDGTGSSGAGLEIVAIDRGPGMPDAALSRQDGYSTAGTLGHGLGSIERQADGFDLFTHPSGTAVLARVFREGQRPALQDPGVELGAVLVSKPGETVSGDGFGWRARPDRLSILVADGLGHGLQAHEAASRAVDVFRSVADESPSRTIQDVHAALRSTRGAAVASLAADLDRGIVRYCGLGNIAGHILPQAGSRQSMVSQNGTAGATAPRIQEFSYPLGPRALLVMHSDGVSSNWDLTPYPGLRSRTPSLIAAVVYRDFSRRRDDVVIVVARQR